MLTSFLEGAGAGCVFYGETEGEERGDKGGLGHGGKNKETVREGREALEV